MSGKTVALVGWAVAVGSTVGSGVTGVVGSGAGAKVGCWAGWVDLGVDGFIVWIYGIWTMIEPPFWLYREVISSSLKLFHRH